MEAVGRLAGGIAHDFNNLLTVILGYGRRAGAKLPAQDPLTNNVVEIRKAGERAAALTQKLLAFSRKQVLRPRIFSVNHLDRRHRRHAAPAASARKYGWSADLDAAAWPCRRPIPGRWNRCS